VCALKNEQGSVGGCGELVLQMGAVGGCGKR